LLNLIKGSKPFSKKSIFVLNNLENLYIKEFSLGITNLRFLLESSKLKSHENKMDHIAGCGLFIAGSSSGTILLL